MPSKGNVHVRLGPNILLIMNEAYLVRFSFGTFCLVGSSSQLPPEQEVSGLWLVLCYNFFLYSHHYFDLFIKKMCIYTSEFRVC